MKAIWRLIEAVINNRGELKSLRAELKQFRREVRKEMSELTDAVAAIGNDVGELQTAVQRVLDLLTQPDPDVAAAVAALQNADAAFDAIRDSLNAAGTPEG